MYRVYTITIYDIRKYTIRIYTTTALIQATVAQFVNNCFYQTEDIKYFAFNRNTRTIINVVWSSYFFNFRIKFVI